MSLIELILNCHVYQQIQQKYKQDLANKADEITDYMDKNNLKGIVLAGRPYHVDPEVNHGIDTLITSLGLCVLSNSSSSKITCANFL